LPFHTGTYVPSPPADHFGFTTHSRLHPSRAHASLLPHPWFSTLIGMESAMADELPDPDTRVGAVTPTRSTTKPQPQPQPKAQPARTKEPSPTTPNAPSLPPVPSIAAHQSYGSASTSDLPSGTSSSGDSLSAGAHPGDSTPRASKKDRHPRTPKAGKRWNKSVDHSNLDPPQRTPSTPNSTKRGFAGGPRGEGAPKPAGSRRSEGGMATAFGERPPGRGVSSPRPKGRGTLPTHWMGRRRRNKEI
jgi:hypothetical protein